MRWGCDAGGLSKGDLVTKLTAIGRLPEIPSGFTPWTEWGAFLFGWHHRMFWLKQAVDLPALPTPSHSLTRVRAGAFLQDWAEMINGDEHRPGGAVTLPVHNAGSKPENPTVLLSWMRNCQSRDMCQLSAFRLLPPAPLRLRVAVQFLTATLSLT